MARRKFTYDYPRPAVTVDVVVVTRGRTPRVLLIRRGKEPFAGSWALPGGFIEMDETLEVSARRELREETGLTVEALTPVGTFGDPGRDPRGRTISVVFLARVEPAAAKAVAGDDAAAADWFPLVKLPPLAFDHAQILEAARAALKRRPREKE